MDPHNDPKPKDFVCLDGLKLLPGETDHFECSVVDYQNNKVCRCECTTCKRAWWDEGRPTVQEGKIVRR